MIRRRILIIKTRHSTLVVMLKTNNVIALRAKFEKTKYIRLVEAEE